MSVESPPPPSEESPADPSGLPPEEGGGDQDWLPKVKRRHRKSESGAEERETSDREILVLCSLLLTNLLDKRAAVVETPVEARAKVNRFPAKSGVPAAQSNAPLDVAPAASAPTGPQIRLKPRTAKGAAAKGHWQQQNSLWERSLGYLLAALIVAAFVYFVGRKLLRTSVFSHAVTSSQTVGPVAKPTVSWSPALMSQLDAMLSADQSGDLKNARQLAIALRAQMPDSPALDLYFSTLQVRTGDYTKSEESVFRMLNAYTPPLLAAAINENLGFIYTRKRDLPLAIAAFADAAAADPFNAVHFYHWGEALRRKGQLKEAADRFTEAQLRLPVGVPGTESQRNEAEYKLNLTQIEMGQNDEDVKAAINDHLKNPVPSGYWLLTAAAYAMQHDDMATAADDLQKARRLFSPEIYTALASDYFLHSFAGHDEVSSYLNVGPAASRAQQLQPRMGYFIDP